MLKSTKTLLVGCAMTAMLVACSTVPQQPADVAAKVCPSLTTTISSLQDLVGLSEEETALLDKAAKIVKPVCDMDFAKVQSMDLKTLAADAVPKLLVLVKGSKLLTDEQKNQVILGISAAKIVIANLP